MLTKEKRTKLIGSLLTLTMATTMVAGCSSEEDEATAEWSNENAAVEQQSNSSFWDMVTAFGLGYALSSLFRGNSTPPPMPPKQPPAYSSTTKPGDTQTKATQSSGSSVSNSTGTAATTSKVSSPTTGKTGIGSSSIRSSAVS